ncbi:sensor histidine kinase [Paenibacillus planticolens]|uniref:HAMP domain-containing protein n=1 Tax=Paenibacillus planticolens TaxID=2654976 RepID=A0ABX1ZQ29_9BACL|nr:histidine kinase [Paenibacillus planticolens]NOV01763.1 HAMP domain-containing protein [Paenibacillus planticolens]
MINKFGFQGKIFLVFIIIFVGMVTFFSTYLYVYMKRTLIHTDQINLAPVTQQISDQIDTLYKELGNAAISYTNDLENLELMIDLYHESGNSSAAPLVYKTKLAINLNTIYNAVSHLYKVIIFIPEKNIFFTYIRDEHLVESIPARYAYPSNGSTNRRLTNMPPHLDDWSSLPQRVISVVSKFSTPYNKDFGMIEIQIPYQSLERVGSIKSKNAGKEVLIFDDNGSLLFPYLSEDDWERETRTLRLIQAIKAHGMNYGEISVDNRSFLYSSFRSDYTGWTTVMTDDERMLQKNVRDYKNIIVLSSSLILFTVLIVYYILIQRLTRPLKLLTQKVRTVSLDNLSMKVTSTEPNEFKLLHQSFNDMLDKIRESINNEYESRIRETEAHSSALQAQINPHFIYNTLSVITAHCEDSGADVAADMCYRLAGMMRYTASSSCKDVLLSEEIGHSIDFLELMKLHYDDSLEYEIHLPEPLNAMRVPKLTLQPLVENCINHGFEHVLPPWRIRIYGTMLSPDHWEITIEDNGSGIEPVQLAELSRQLTSYRDNYEHGKLLTNLKIGGLGILNTYARLIIYFGTHFYFHITNLEERGCKIQLGVRRPLEEEAS